MSSPPSGSAFISLHVHTIGATEVAATQSNLQDLSREINDLH